MDFLNQLSDNFCDTLLPRFKCELELAYTISMVLLAVKSADNDGNVNAEYAWHKTYLFYSFLRTLLYVKGTEVVLAICMGESPVAQLADNTTLLTVFVVWWLALFVPFDVFNRLLNVQVGDVKPVTLVLLVLTTLRMLVAVDSAVAGSLAATPGSLIAVFIGTLAGNGCLAVTSVFGDFARQISSESATKNAFVTALCLTLARVYFAKIISSNLAFSICALVMLPMQVLQQFGHEVEIFSCCYNAVKTVVCTRDLVKDKQA